ncbi:MAG: helix-turn-helix transcriptional regulator [Alphaproteobacteria bacterium]|nr:helix-turn-helix transcriptional regulator [Alphaproteobacteria bacterium]
MGDVADGVVIGKAMPARVTGGTPDLRDLQMSATLSPVVSDISKAALTERQDAPVFCDVGEEQCAMDPRRPVRNKRYAMPALGVVLSGWFDYRAESGMATAVPGAAVFGNAGEEFSCHHADAFGNKRLVAIFNDKFLGEVADGCGLGDSRFHAATLPPGRHATALFGQMRRLAKAPAQEDAAYRLAATALRAGRAGPKSDRVLPAGRQRILSVVRHIESSYQRRCSLDTLADLAGLSRYRFLHLFKQVTGQTPNQYVINTRLRAAAERLMATNLPVYEVAFSVGFEDLSYFNACFRRQFGAPPRQWRTGA